MAEPALASAIPVPHERRLFSREEYERLVEVGVLGPDDRVELIEGEIVRMTPMNSPHAACIRALTHMLEQAVEGRLQVSVQLPLRVGDFSEPQPDLALLKPSPDFYRSRHPEPADVLLVIEISDTTLAFDREVKIPLYGRHGVPETWLVDLAARRIEVHRDPRPSGYKTMERVEAGETLRVPDCEGVVLSASDIVGASL
ncbi:MAG: Uma2 family endonuclease [Candidatus Sumerlaeota bacterium]|nr:Uma2 family endonuclease [Candidatus Sumerlaeota bacterium]